MQETLAWIAITICQIIFFGGILFLIGVGVNELRKLLPLLRDQPLLPVKEKPDYGAIYAMEKDLGMAPTTDKGKEESQYLGGLMDDIDHFKNKVRCAEVEAGKTTMSSYFDRNGIHVDDLMKMGFTEEQIAQMILEQEG